MVLQEQGVHADAADLFRSVPTAAPDATDAHFHLAGAQMAMGELESALQSYQQVLRRQPNNLDAATNRGYILKKLGRYEEAERALRSALDLNPPKAIITLVPY